MPWHATRPQTTVHYLNTATALSASSYAFTSLSIYPSISLEITILYPPVYLSLICLCEPSFFLASNSVVL